MLLFHNETKTKEQSQQTKCELISRAIQGNKCRTSICTLQSLSELHGMSDKKLFVRVYIVSNDSHNSHSFQASKHTGFFFLSLPAALKVHYEQAFQ